MRLFPIVHVNIDMSVKHKILTPLKHDPKDDFLTLKIRLRQVFNIKFWLKKSLNIDQR